MLEYFALFLVFFVFIVIIYGVVAIHDIPYLIALKRNHPHQDAIHVAGWVSLFLMHVLWPLLWIWATLYRQDRGWGFSDGKTSLEHIQILEQKVERLEKIVHQLSQQRGGN